MEAKGDEPVLKTQHTPKLDSKALCVETVCVALKTLANKMKLCKHRVE